MKNKTIKVKTFDDYRKACKTAKAGDIIIAEQQKWEEVTTKKTKKQK